MSSNAVPMNAPFSNAALSSGLTPTRFFHMRIDVRERAVGLVRCPGWLGAFNRWTGYWTEFRWLNWHRQPRGGELTSLIENDWRHSVRTRRSAIGPSISA